MVATSGVQSQGTAVCVARVAGVACSCVGRILGRIKRKVAGGGGPHAKSQQPNWGGRVNRVCQNVNRRPSGEEPGRKSNKVCNVGKVGRRVMGKVKRSCMSNVVSQCVLQSVLVVSELFVCPGNASVA